MNHPHRLHIFSFGATAALVCVLCSIAGAQSTPPSIQWERTYGGSRRDAAYSIQRTTDGGYIVSGETESPDGDVTGEHFPSFDFWIVKLSVGRDIEWQRTLGGSKQEWYCRVRQTTDGGYIVAGMTQSSDGDITNNKGQNDFWVVKLSKIGAIEWQQTYGGSGDEYPYSIELTSDGGYILAGFSTSNDGDVSGNHGGRDYWILKISSIGAIQWQKSLGGTRDEFATSAKQTTDGGYIVAGYTRSNNGDVTSNHGEDDFWIVKLSSVGAIEWQKTYGGSNRDWAACIQQTTEGGYIVAGWTQSLNGDVTGFHGNAAGDVWVLKLSASGIIEWEKAFGGTNDEGAQSIQQTFDGGYVVAGGSISSDGDATINHGYYDFWIVKLTNGGALEWQTSLGGTGDDNAAEIVQTPDGGYIVAGRTDSTNGDVSAHPGGGSADFWIVKLGPPIPIISSARQQEVEQLCDGAILDTLYVHNVGKDALTIFSAVFLSGQEFSLVQPSAFPVVIQSGDSLAFVSRFATAISGSYNDALRLLNNDTALAHSPWVIAFTGVKDSVGFMVGNIASDTLNFGGVACNTTWDTIFTLENISSAGTTFLLQTANGIFSVLPSIYLKSGVGNQIPVHFSGGAPGLYSSSLQIEDTCGRLRSFVLEARVDSAMFGLSLLRDTATCPGDSSVRVATIHNYSAVMQGMHFSGGSAAFSLTPDTLTLAPGDSATIKIVFHGSATIGSYAASYVFTDNCGTAHAITETIHVDTASLTAQTIADIVTCINDSVVQQSWLHNISTVSQTVLLDGDNGLFSISPDSVTLAAGDSALVNIVFRGAASGGSYTVHYGLPGCGSHHSLSATVRVDTGTVTALAVSDTTICPNTPVSRTLTFINTSSVVQIVRPSGNNGLFTLSPDSLLIAPGASGIFTIVFRAPATLGANNVSYVYLDACNVPHSLTVQVNVDTQSVTMRALADTTVCPGDAATRTIVAHNVTNVTQNVRLLGSDPLFSVAPFVATIAPGDSAAFTVSFRGSNTIGKHRVQYSYPGACGASQDLFVSVIVDTASITASRIADATVCPGVPVFSDVTIRNVSSSVQHVPLNSGDTHFSVVPDSVTLAPGDSATVQIVFHGAPDTGTYSAVCALPGCGVGNVLQAVVHVQSPNIRIPFSLDTTICPFTPIAFKIPIINLDSITHTLTLQSATGVLSRTSLTLGPAARDTVVLSFPGGPMGLDVTNVVVTDDCGIAHNVDVTMNIRSAPPLQLSLRTAAGPTRVGMERKVYLVATPPSSVASGNFSFTVANEPTALEFDSIATQCSTTIVRGANNHTITFNTCSLPASDTIATLYYQTLVGSTLSPTVTLLNAATTNTCDTVSGAGAATINLLPPGCELGTVVVHPFASGIQAVYPNPATGTIVITYATVQEGYVALVLCDPLGSTVQTIVQTSLKPGVYSVECDTRSLMSGVYHLMLQTGSKILQREMLIMR